MPAVRLAQQVSIACTHALTVESLIRRPFQKMVKMGWSKLRTCELSSSDSSTTPYSGTVKTGFLSTSVAACLDGVGFLVIDKRVVAQLALRLAT